MKIITGYRGEPHITSNDDQASNQGVWGSGSYVLSVGKKFSPTTISANEIEIGDGEGVLQGVRFRVAPGEYDSVMIESGSQGMQRTDLIVARYTRDATTGVEDVSWVVLTGTPAASSPVTPTPTTGDVLNGATVADFPMFQVSISGVNISDVSALFTVLDSSVESMENIAAVSSDLDSIRTTQNLVYDNTWTFPLYTITGAGIYLLLPVVASRVVSWSLTGEVYYQAKWNAATIPEVVLEPYRRLRIAFTNVQGVSLPQNSVFLARLTGNIQLA